MVERFRRCSADTIRHTDRTTDGQSDSNIPPPPQYLYGRGEPGITMDKNGTSKLVQLTSRAVRQAGLGDVGDTLKVVMALVTEVGGAEAEEHSHRATVATFVLQKV